MHAKPVPERHPLHDVVVAILERDRCQDATKLGVALAGGCALTVEAVRKLASWGGDRRSEKAKENQVRDTNLKSSETRAYLLARLKRDNPEIKVEEFSSAGLHVPARLLGSGRKRLVCPRGPTTPKRLLTKQTTGVVTHNATVYGLCMTTKHRG